MARRRSTIVVGALIAAVTGLFLVSVVAGDTTAGAQDDACDDVLNFGADFEVSTGEELIAAFTCANQSASIDIVLLNDIVVETVSSESVLPQLGGPQFFNSEIYVDGRGHSIRRGPTAADTALPLISIDTEVDTALVLFETAIVLSEADTAAVQSNSVDFFFRLWASSIVTSAGSTATALDMQRNGGIVEITQSAIVGAEVAINAQSAQALAVFDSTFASSDTDIRTGLDSFFIEVTNSTLTAPTAIEAVGGVAFVTSSTITGDGFVAPAGSNAQAVFRSSIVGSCSTPLLPDHDDVTFPTPFHVDYGGNVGGCFGLDTPVEPLADNDCFWDPSSLCTPTAALLSDSPARGAGDCSASDVGGSQEVTLDQRGADRTPAGPGCDAGAFESANAVGDVEADGDVDNADVMALLAWLAGGVAPAGADAADVNGDGEVRLDDALLLAQLVADG